MAKHLKDHLIEALFAAIPFGVVVWVIVGGV
jgi:hypothetical protein